MAINYKLVNQRAIAVAQTLNTPLTKLEAFDVVWSIAVEMQQCKVLPKVSLNVFRTNISEELSKHCPPCNKEVFRFFRWYPFVPAGRSGSWAPQFNQEGISNVPAFDDNYSPASPSSPTPSVELVSWKNVTVAPAPAPAHAPAATPAPVANNNEVAQLKSELTEVKAMLAKLLQKQLENA
jgi:hypothetical protein